MPRISKVTLAKIALPIVTLGMCLLMTEVVARVLFSRTTLNLGLEMWKYAKDVKLRSADPEIGHRHRPNAQAQLMGVDVKTNSLGLRDVERAIPKPADVYRIVVLGDSITFGWGVAFEHTFCQVLERKLNQNPPIPGKRFEVVNTGVGNTNTSMEVRYFEAEGYKLEPDLVLLAWFINDAEPTPVPTENWLAYHSYAYTWITSMVDEVRRNNDKQVGWQDYYRGLYADSQPGWGKSQKAIADLASFCKDKRIPCRVFLIPELHTVGPKYEFADVHAKVAAVCAAAGLPVLELLDAFPAEQDPRKWWVSPGDAHPNGDGEELMGERLDRALREEQWVH